MGWLHAYNEHGPKALTYQRTGGRPPFVQISLPHWASRSVPRSVRRPPSFACSVAPLSPEQK